MLAKSVLVFCAVMVFLIPVQASTILCCQECKIKEQGHCYWKCPRGFYEVTTTKSCVERDCPWYPKPWVCCRKIPDCCYYCTLVGGICLPPGTYPGWKEWPPAHFSCQKPGCPWWPQLWKCYVPIKPSD